MISEKTIAKLKNFLQEEKVGSRRFQKYKLSTAEFTNCFFHAIFNFTNKQIKKLKLDKDDKKTFKAFFKNGTQAQAIADIKNFVEKVGLSFEICNYDSPIDKGDTKVAIFFQDNLMSRDFHFFREEKLKNGKSVWVCKEGFTTIVKKFPYLDMKMNNMSFYGCYKISQPKACEKCVSKEKTKWMTI